MLQTLLTIFVAALIVGGLVFSVMLFREPCDTLGCILSDWLVWKFGHKQD